MASQQKQEKIFIFKDRELGKKRYIFFIFHGGTKVTTNPRHYSRSIWHHRKKKNKKMIFNDRNLAKNKIYFLIFHGGAKVTTNPRP